MTTEREGRDRVKGRERQNDYREGRKRQSERKGETE